MIEPNVAAFVFKKICESVQKLHKLGIAHRDLKPENMFFRGSEMDKVILIDFGSSEDLEQPELRKVLIDDDPRRKSHVNFVGTSQYMAPECARNKEVGLPADIWSLGCILYQLLVGVPPFRGASDYLVFRRSTEARYNLVHCMIPDQAKTLIKGCLNVNPQERMSIEELLNNPFLQQ